MIAIGASGWFAFNDVSTKIDNLSDKLTTTEGERDTALNQKRAAEKERDDFKTEADQAKAAASRLNDQLGSLSQEVARQKQRADQHAASV
ncbi:MAG: hypothetical protein OXS32_14265, partial [Verrucomicrobiales bacterium]|nr:hypothetical protein [Verrucomicrobiales bacterium]